MIKNLLENPVVRVVELMPDDSHKSFYGKAKVITLKDGTELLQSYKTIVLVKEKTGKLLKTWGGYSATTQRHIKAFAKLNKSETQALESSNENFSVYIRG